MKENHSKVNLFRTKDILSIIFFILFMGISLYQINLLYDTPLGHGRLVSYLLLLFSLSLMIFLGIGLLRHFTNFIKNSWLFYTFQFLMALILPLIIISNIENKIQKTILVTVKNEFTPIITYIKDYKSQNGNVPTNIDKALFKSHTLRSIYYLNDSYTFMLETDVSTIDIDGAKIFYDSRDKQWYQFHNDEYQYYQDKKDKPKSIDTYMSRIKQMKTTQSILIKSKAGK